MSNDLIAQKSWLKHHWKWLVPSTLILLMIVTSILTSGFGGILGDYSKAYADPELYQNALEKVRQNDRAKYVLGTVQPVDNMAILNGSTTYSDNNLSVNSTIKITCEKGKAMLDISANRINDSWSYTKITIRIKNPPENREIIEIIKPLNKH